MNFVGIDLHWKTISICVVDKERTVVERKHFYCREPERISGFFDGLSSSPAVVGATASYEWLVEPIEPLADRMVRAHPGRCGLSPRVPARVTSSMPGFSRSSWPWT